MAAQVLVGHPLARPYENHDSTTICLYVKSDSVVRQNGCPEVEGGRCTVQLEGYLAWHAPGSQPVYVAMSDREPNRFGCCGENGDIVKDLRQVV